MRYHVFQVGLRHNPTKHLTLRLNSCGAHTKSGYIDHDNSWHKIRIALLQGGLLLKRPLPK